MFQKSGRFFLKKLDPLKIGAELFGRKILPSFLVKKKPEKYVKSIQLSVLSRPRIFFSEMCKYSFHFWKKYIFYHIFQGWQNGRFFLKIRIGQKIGRTPGTLWCKVDFIKINTWPRITHRKNSHRWKAEIISSSATVVSSRRCVKVGFVAWDRPRVRPRVW